MISRRKLLITGGASLLVLGAGFGGYVLTRSIDKARQPWTRAGQSFGDARLDALAYAILAPSPHNLQPWQVRLEDEDAFTVSCDLERRLPATDPLDRQLVIGFGAFLELFRQAAAEKGYRTETEPFPEGEPEPVLDNRPVAKLRMVKDATISPDPLFDTILDRRTMRVPFDETAVEKADLDKLGSLALQEDLTGSCVFASTNAAKEVAWHKDIHKQGWNAEIENKATHAESLKWTRNGSAEVNKNPDGIALYGPMMDAMATTGLMTKEGMAEPGSVGFEGSRNFYNDLIDSSRAFGWISTSGNSRLDQLQAGAAWVRIHQAATQLGIAMHPISQVLQEFPAMQKHYDAFHAYLGFEAPARVQGLFRFGYADSVGPSPRWPLESKIISA